MRRRGPRNAGERNALILEQALEKDSQAFAPDSPFMVSRAGIYLMTNTFCPQHLQIRAEITYDAVFLFAVAEEEQLDLAVKILWMVEKLIVVKIAVSLTPRCPSMWFLWA